MSFSQERAQLYVLDGSLFYLETFELVVSVHDQLRLVSVHSDKDHVFRTAFQVTTHKLVCGSVGEVLGQADMVDTCELSC